MEYQHFNLDARINTLRARLTDLEAAHFGDTLSLIGSRHLAATAGNPDQRQASAGETRLLEQRIAGYEATITRFRQELAQLEQQQPPAPAEPDA